jgi:ribonuclease D
MTQTARSITEFRDVQIVAGDLTSGQFETFCNADVIAWDIETTGLDWRVEKIATCQIYCQQAVPVIVRMTSHAPILLPKLLDSRALKLFHHAAFDLRFMVHNWRCGVRNVACTKIASKVLKAPTKEGHRLQSLVKEYLGVNVDKALAKSNWLAADLTEAQIRYAISDTIYLSDLFRELKEQLVRKGRWGLAAASFEYLPTRVQLDLLGADDVFTY